MNHVCYEKKILKNNKKIYIGCSENNITCSRLNKRGFAGGLSKKKQKLALWQCQNLSEKEIIKIVCKKNPRHHKCKRKIIPKIPKCLGKENCLTLGGTESECSNWCR